MSMGLYLVCECPITQTCTFITLHNKPSNPCQYKDITIENLRAQFSIDLVVIAMAYKLYFDRSYMKHKGAGGFTLFDPYHRCLGGWSKYYSMEISSCN